MNIKKLTNNKHGDRNGIFFIPKAQALVAIKFILLVSIGIILELK
jgi:hypothetical protein